MPSILKKPTYRAKLPRYGHDLSRRVLFTSSIGHLIPILSDFLNPGDKVKLNESLFTRTQPLNTCAFVRINEHVEYFFVPIQQIDPYFNNAFYGINDFDNTNDLVLGSQSSYVSGISAPAAANNACVNMYDLRHYFFDEVATSVSQVHVKAITTPNGGNKSSVLMDGNISVVCDEYLIPRVFNFLRLASALGYSESITNTDYGAQGSTAPATAQNNPLVNLYRFAAYQKIWYDYYRLSDWESNEPFSYNFGQLNKLDNPDQYYTLLWTHFFEDNQLGNQLSFQLFKLRYRPLKKDYFTSVLPTPYFSSQLSPAGYGVGLRNPSQTVTSLQSYILSSYGVQLQSPESVVVNSPFKDGLTSTNVSDYYQRDIQVSDYQFDSSKPYSTLQQHRLMYAFEQLISATQRAAKHYEDQTLAHFGYSVPKGVSNEVYFLGGHTSHLMIGEVVATAAGQNGDNNSSLGEIGGRGLGTSGKNNTIQFTAPCHGILMALYSAVPDIEYQARGLDYQNAMCNINMYPRPEFDNIGMQPLWQFESNLSYLSGLNASYYMGWHYRYSQFKLSYDQTHGAFNYTLNNWSMSYTFGSAGYAQTPVYDFYCSPCLLDNVFSLSFRPTYQEISGTNGFCVGYLNKANDTAVDVDSSMLFDSSAVYERDPLLHSVDISYRKTSWMSTYGLPKI